jgi:aconitate hydratase
MGVLPLQFKTGENCDSLGLDGSEVFDIQNSDENLTPNGEINVIATKIDDSKVEFKAIMRLNSSIVIEYYQNGGILQYVLRNFLKKNKN